MNSLATILILIVAGVLGFSADAFTPEPNVYYKLVTKDREPSNECLEGNIVARSSKLGGASFMAPCADPTSGQKWKFISRGNGVYSMKNQGSPNKCFVENELASSSPRGGALFLVSCKNVEEQKWKIQQAGAYFKLSTLSPIPHGECLDGNDLAGSKLRGAVFVSNCVPSDGQLWKAIPVKKSIAVKKPIAVKN